MSLLLHLLFLQSEKHLLARDFKEASPQVNISVLWIHSCVFEIGWNVAFFPSRSEM